MNILPQKRKKKRLLHIPNISYLYRSYSIHSWVELFESILHPCHPFSSIISIDLRTQNPHKKDNENKIKFDITIGNQLELHLKKQKVN